MDHRKLESDREQGTSEGEIEREEKIGMAEEEMIAFKEI